MTGASPCPVGDSGTEMARRVWVTDRALRLPLPLGRREFDLPETRCLCKQGADLLSLVGLAIVFRANQPVGGEIAALHDALALGEELMDVALAARHVDHSGGSARLVELLLGLAGSLIPFDPANRFLVGILQGARPAP